VRNHLVFNGRDHTTAAVVLHTAGDRGIGVSYGARSRSLMLVRLAALAAVDAPVPSYLMHVGPAMDAGLTVQDAEDVLVAVAPIVGAPRTAAAAAKISEALDVAIEVALDESE
jgi:hypothetical protein